MKKTSLSLIITLLVTIMISCSPTTKESYLKKYGEFITEISNDYKTYTDADWVKMTKRYEKFSSEWYNKFSDQLSFKEKLIVESYQIKYHYYRNVRDVTGTIKQMFDKLDISGMTRQVKYYVDNNMIDDLKNFYEQAKGAGRDVQEAVTNIFEELKINADEL